jgi:hypothetical protein
MREYRMHGTFAVNAGDEKFMQTFSLGKLEGKENCTDRHRGATIFK